MSRRGLACACGSSSGREGSPERGELTGRVRDASHRQAGPLPSAAAAKAGPLRRRPTFFFLTGLSILMMHFSPLRVLMPSNTSLYLPRPTLRTTS